MLQVLNRSTLNQQGETGEAQASIQSDSSHRRVPCNVFCFNCRIALANIHRIKIHIPRQLKTTPTSQMPLLNFGDCSHTAPLASLMEAGQTQSDNGPLGCGREAGSYVVLKNSQLCWMTCQKSDETRQHRGLGNFSSMSEHYSRYFVSGSATPPLDLVLVTRSELHNPIAELRVILCGPDHQHQWCFN